MLFATDFFLVVFDLIYNMLNIMSAFDLCCGQLVSLVKFVDLETTIERGVHVNKYRLDLMHNRGTIAVEFYCERKKVRPLSI